MADLTTLANVKQWLNISGATDDALLTRMVSAASLFIENWLNQPILAQDFTVTFDGWGGRRKSLVGYPINSVASVTVNGAAIPAAVGAMASGYIYSQSQILLRNYVFTDGVANCSITYNAGYATTPKDVEQACIELVGLKYKTRDRIGLSSKSMAGESISFFDTDMSDSVRSALRNYVRHTPN